MTLIWEMVLCLVPPSNSLDYVSDPLRAFCADTVIFKGFPQEYHVCRTDVPQDTVGQLTQTLIVCL